MSTLERLPPERRRPENGTAELGVYRPPVSLDEPPGNPMNLREILGSFRRHWRLILVMTVVTTGVAGYMVMTQRVEYSSASVLRLKDAQRALTGNLAASPTQGFAGRAVDPVQSQIEILTSRSVAAQVVDSVHELRVSPGNFPDSLLAKIVTTAVPDGDSIALVFSTADYLARGRKAQGRAVYGDTINLGGFRFTLARRPTVPDGYITLIPRDDAVKRLLSRIRVRLRENTDVVDVMYMDRDAIRTQAVAGTLVEIFQGISAQTANQESVRRRKFLEGQLQYNDSLLNEARAELSRFRGRQRAFSTRTKLTAEQEGLSGLEVRRAEMDADRRVFQALLQQLEQDQADRQQIGALMSAPDLASNPVVSGLYTQLSGYQAARDSLTTGSFASKATHPDVQRLDALIASTESKLVTAVKGVITSFNARIEALDAMRSRNATNFPALSATEEDESRLVEQEESARQMVAQLRSEYEKARLAEAVEAGSIEILDPASAPVALMPVGPIRKIGFGMALGLMLGCGLAYLLDRMNSSIRRREQIRTVLRLPELAVIPQVRRSLALRARRNGAPSLRNGVRVTHVTGGPAPQRGEMLVAHDIRSTGAEAYRLLRTNLLFAIPSGSPRTLVVTSPAPGDGKTTVAANLAATFARQGIRVLLIDCDLRRGRIHAMFRIPREPGLTQVIHGQASLAETALQTSIDGLMVLPTGAVPSNPGELVGGDAMRALLELASQEFALVVLDTPPVLAAADAAVLSSMVDATVLVLRAGRTREEEAQTTLEQLFAVNARVVGAVLNDQDSKLEEYGENSYYYSGYYGPES